MVIDEAFIDRAFKSQYPEHPPREIAGALIIILAVDFDMHKDAASQRQRADELVLYVDKCERAINTQP
jgi:hypothetical protein